MGNNIKIISPRKETILLITLGICIIVFIVFCVAMGQRNENRYAFFDQVIDASEIHIVQTAIDVSGVELEKNAEQYMHVLFDAVWYYGTENIEIVSAEVIPFVNEDIETTPNNPLEGYAVRIVDFDANVYTIWYGEGLQRVQKNGKDILFLYKYIQ